MQQFGELFFEVMNRVMNRQGSGSADYRAVPNQNTTIITITYMAGVMSSLFSMYINRNQSGQVY